MRSERIERKTARKDKLKYVTSIKSEWCPPYDNGLGYSSFFKICSFELCVN